MKITLVNNAETEEDFLRKLQGRENYLLNDTGRRQALRLKMKLQDRLVEREVGEFEGRPDVEYNAYKYWDYDLNKGDFGVEPVHDVFKRCKDFLNYIKKEHPDEDIIIVTHSGPYRALRHLLLNHKIKGKLLDGKINSCQVEEFEIKK